jgi:ABC-2 type transport system permease protein/lipopolysaccharide transport system permease protein
LVRHLVDRDLRVRYKQSWLGWAWALITPLITIVLFSFFFKRVGHVKTGSAPYPLFAYLGLLPWGFFTGAFSAGSSSLITNRAILQKVYLPREVFVVNTVMVAAFDAVVSAVGLAVLFAVYRYPPRVAMLWVLPLIAVAIAFSTGMALAFSVFLVRLRDMGNVISVIIQAGMFVTPVAWSLNAIPKEQRVLYCAINPMAAVIDGFRRSSLSGQAPRWNLVGVAAATSFFVLVFGYLVFRRLEGSVADVT